MIRSLQLKVSLGRFDINTAIMTLSSFRVSPRKGHLKRAQQIYGDLAKFQNSAIRIQADEPNYSNINIDTYEWSKSVYGKCKGINT